MRGMSELVLNSWLTMSSVGTQHSDLHLPNLAKKLKQQSGAGQWHTHWPIPLHFALISWERRKKSSKINSNQVDLPLMGFMAAQHCWDVSSGGTWSHFKSFMMAVWHDTIRKTPWPWQGVCCCKNVMCTSIKEDTESTVWMMFYYKPNRSLDRNQSRCWLTRWLLLHVSCSCNLSLDF